MRKTLAALLAALTPYVPPAQPDPPRIVVVGDSVTEQAYSYLGGWVDAPGDVVKIAGAGWDVDDVEGPYATAVAEDPPDVTVVALGPNDADPTAGGWTLYDIANWWDLLDTAPEGSCVVVVLPRHGAGFPHAWAVELDEARTNIVDLVAPGGSLNPPPGRSYVLTDWRMTTAPHPAFLGDWIVQTDYQAANKTTSWKANQQHMLGYHLTLGALAAVAVPVWAVAVIVAVSWSTHAVIDRRWPVIRLMEATGSGPFSKTTFGVIAVDQALHLSILSILAAALGGT